MRADADAEAEAAGRRVVGRRRRVEKLAVVVVLQNVLVVACLLVTFCVYLSSGPEKDAHIEFQVNPVVAANSETTLESSSVSTSHMMGLANGTNISTNCNGPYVLYMKVCFKSLNNEKSSAVLKLQLEGKETLISFTLTGSREEACRELHGTVYLSVAKKAALRLFSRDSRFKITSTTVGLNCLLGNRCEF